MYAVIRTGGKQYRVEAGQRLHVERLPGAVGDRVELPEVLMVGGSDTTVVGTPIVAKAHVVGEIVEQGRAPKITIFKYKSKTRYRRVSGHRQLRTQLAITEIAAPDGETATYEVRRPATVAPTEPVTAEIEPVVDGETEPAPAEHEAETETEATAEEGVVPAAEAAPDTDSGADEAEQSERVAVAPAPARKTAAKKATKRRTATKTAAKKAAKKTGARKATARKTSARKTPTKKEES